VDLRAFDPENGCGMTGDPVIEFACGTRLAFLVRETEVEPPYGVDLVVLPAPSGRARTRAGAERALARVARRMREDRSGDEEDRARRVNYAAGIERALRELAGARP
jgi:hypothetical protein